MDFKQRKFWKLWNWNQHQQRRGGEQHAAQSQEAARGTGLNHPWKRSLKYPQALPSVGRGQSTSRSREKPGQWIRKGRSKAQQQQMNSHCGVNSDCSRIQAFREKKYQRQHKRSKIQQNYRKTPWEKEIKIRKLVPAVPHQLRKRFLSSPRSGFHTV